MASLKIIRKRISSVRSTQQITKAMKMVAAAKLRRAQEAVVQSRAYAAKLSEVVASLASEASLREHRLVRVRTPESRVLLIVLTADRGLCGGFNANLIRQSETFLAREGATPSLAIVGRKGFDYYKKRAVEIREQYVGIAGRAPIEIARQLVARAVELFVTDEVDAVYVLYSQFRSALSQTPTIERVLPIEAPAAETDAGREYLFEPSREAVIEDLLPRYVEVKIFQALLESIASEHGARMTAMDSATNNASDMIERLTLEMNRARQATITKELMEIVGGAEALKG
ncbi:MAG: ATP synthase F1 subunit gamma [Deltaproteobacteria bacterium]|nr:ATP synthase F1 subunit gamma [Deltaproteobacteria bacterium]